MEMYTVQEVAERLKVSEGTVRNYLSEGKIKYVKILGNTRIKKEELDKLIIPVDKGGIK